MLKRIFWGLSLGALLALGSCGGNNQSASSLGKETPQAVVDPSTAAAKHFSGNGIYWNPSQSGSGFFFEAQGNTGIASFYLYEDGTGKAIWYTAAGAFVANTDGSYSFSGQLQKFVGGQAVTSSVVTTPTSTTLGAVSISFNGNNATAQLPTRTIDAKRFEFGGLNKPATELQPESGIYWSPEQGGRGFSIEVQNNLAVVTMYHYNTDGTPTWNLMTGDISTGSVSGSFDGFRGGQTLTNANTGAPTGPFSVGTLKVSFPSACDGQIQLLGMPVINVRKFAFGGMAAGDECRAPLVIKFSDRATAAANGWEVSTPVSFVDGLNGGKAAKFGGVASPGHIRIPNSDRMKFTNEATFDYLTRLDSGQGMTGFGTTSTTSWEMATLAKSHDARGAALRFAASGLLYAATTDQSWILGSGATCTYPAGSNPGVSVGSWNRHTVTMSAASGVKTYVNGVLYADCAGLRPNFTTMNGQDLYIGKYSDLWYPMNGAIQDVRIFRRLLTATEIAALGNGVPVTPTPTTPVTPTSTTPAPPTQSLAVTYLGVNDAVEGINADVVVTGADINLVTGASFAGSSCAKVMSRSVAGSYSLFSCPTPSVLSGESRRDAVTVAASTAKTIPSAYVNTWSKAAVRLYDGEFYVAGLGDYLYANQTNNGPKLSITMNALNGGLWTGTPSYFGAILMEGPSGQVLCPYVSGGTWQYQCPTLVPGGYYVKVMRESNTRSVASSTFFVTVAASSGSGGGSTVINGVCGAANGKTLTSAPSASTDLCSVGTATSVLGIGPWTWSCQGSGGGASASCSAQKAAATCDPAISKAC